MAKDSILTGAVNESTFKNKGTESSTSVTKNGLHEERLQTRTKSPRAQNEVTKVLHPGLQKPTKR